MKLRKFLTKGTNYREPKSLNFNKALNEIISAISACIDSLVTKTKHKHSVFKDWKENNVSKVKDIITYLKNKVTPNVTKPVLKDPEVQQYLESLHRKFVIINIDKASNNFAFTCKMFYVNRFLSELVIKNKQFCEKFGLTISEKQKSLPSMYWIPKMHKNPVGARFIVASKTCSTKLLTEIISNVFKMIYKHVENFHKKSYFY